MFGRLESFRAGLVLRVWGLGLGMRALGTAAGLESFQIGASGLGVEVLRIGA